jgi:hypothetical protein
VGTEKEAYDWRMKVKNHFSKLTKEGKLKKIHKIAESWPRKVGFPEEIDDEAKSVASQVLNGIIGTVISQVHGNFDEARFSQRLLASTNSQEGSRKNKLLIPGPDIPMARHAFWTSECPRDLPAPCGQGIQRHGRD